MKALYNFLVMWSLLVAAALALIWVVCTSPFKYIINREEYSQSTDYKVERIRAGFRELEKAFVKQVRENWRE